MPIPPVPPSYIGPDFIKRQNNVAFPISTTPRLVVPEDNDRVVLIFTQPALTGVNLWPFQDATTARSFQLNNYGGLLRLYFHEDAILVTSQWWGFAGAVGSVSFLEVVYKPRR